MEPLLEEAPNYYQILDLTRDATPTELRMAYLKLIKLHHPDKLQQATSESDIFQPNTSSNRFAQLLIEAYSVLIDPDRRKIYDFQIQHPNNSSIPLKNTNQPNIIVTQVVDLSEFSQIDDENVRQEGENLSPERYALGCRCGGQFMIDEDQMEAGVDVVGCDGCSLTIKVEYQSL